MRLPRNISGRDLAKLLEVFGHTVTRQSGSHIRLTTKEKGERLITIPDHKELRTGTLSAIFGDIAEHLDLTKEGLILRLFR